MSPINSQIIAIPDRIDLTSIISDPIGNEWHTTILKSNELIINDKRTLFFAICIVNVDRNLIEKGVVSLEIDNRPYVYIRELKNFTHDHKLAKSSMKGIGAAGLETAIKISFLVGKEGRIRLLTAFSSAFFYYKSGMRFSPSFENFTPSSNLRGPIKTYLAAKEGNEKDALQKGISSHEDFDLFKEILFDNVKENLGREPSDFDELLRFGIFLDLNKYMEKKIARGEIPGRQNDKGRSYECPHFFKGKDMYLPIETIRAKLIQYSLDQKT